MSSRGITGGSLWRASSLGGGGMISGDSSGEDDLLDSGGVSGWSPSGGYGGRGGVWGVPLTVAVSTASGDTGVSGRFG